jgi:radical SAM enzyme (TIGR01210 family)
MRWNRSSVRFRPEFLPASAFCILNSALLDRFVLQHRPQKNQLDPYRAYATMWEEEIDSSGTLASTAVVFVTNRECPFRCVMCDLWVNTLDESVPPGAIATQIRSALADLPPARQVKLYNAGSFFDPAAIPPEDYDAIAEAVGGFERVIVESHPAFLADAHGERCLRFRDLVPGQLEVAIGLETAHPDVLARLNKKMTLDTYRRAAGFLREHRIALRVFILLSPPFMPRHDAVEWACRSLDLAAECGATVATVIPTRGGNGAMEAIGHQFTPPRLPDLETAVEYGLSIGGLRVFADLWNVDRLVDCGCSGARTTRLGVMNRVQQVPPRVVCAHCKSSP